MMPRILDRRTFGKQLTVAAVVSAPLAVAVAAREADEPPAGDAKNAPPTNDAKDATDLLSEVVRRQYPKNLDEPRLAEIRGQIAAQQQRSTLLSGFPLTNADEPAAAFAAWRAEG